MVAWLGGFGVGWVYAPTVVFDFVGVYCVVAYCEGGDFVCVYCGVNFYG